MVNVQKVKGQLCPVCKETSHEKWAPFCSFACKEIDLGKWLGGSYYIPSRSWENEDS